MHTCMTGVRAGIKGQSRPALPHVAGSAGITP